MGNRLDGCGNFETAEIGASENVTCVWRSGQQANVNRNCGVQPDAVRLDC